jgi:hypothetical protein
MQSRARASARAGYVAGVLWDFGFYEYDIKHLRSLQSVFRYAVGMRHGKGIIRVVSVAD